MVVVVVVGDGSVMRPLRTEGYMSIMVLGFSGRERGETSLPPGNWASFYRKKDIEFRDDNQ